MHDLKHLKNKTKILRKKMIFSQCNELSFRMFGEKWKGSWGSTNRTWGSIHHDLKKSPQRATAVTLCKIVRNDHTTGSSGLIHRPSCHTACTRSLSPKPVMSILPATPGIHVMKLLHVNTRSHPHLRTHTHRYRCARNYTAYPRRGETGVETLN